MALLYKQLSPLHGVWKMEESSDELLGMLEHKADYSSFLERVSAEKRRQEHFASRVLLKELLGEEVRVDYHSTGAPFLDDGSNIQCQNDYGMKYWFPIPQKERDINANLPQNPGW